MGLMKWLARRGAVGGTARWAANGYRFFRQRHPDKSEVPDNSIFRLMIVNRYELWPDAKAEQFLLAVVDNLIGIRGLVAAILTVEAGFTENTPSNQSLFMEVIDEELSSAGVAHDVIIGSRRRTPSPS